MPVGSFNYRVAAIIIKDRKLLVAKSSDYPVYYTVGGTVEMNETAEEAVIREVLEETGYSLEVDRLLIVQERFFTVNSRKLHELAFFYQMKNRDDMLIEDGSFTDQPPKETLHWIPIDDLPATNIVPPMLKTLSLESIDCARHIISRE